MSFCFIKSSWVRDGSENLHLLLSVGEERQALSNVRHKDSIFASVDPTPYLPWNVAAG